MTVFTDKSTINYMKLPIPPKLSIIIPAYNASLYVERCIRSILSEMQRAKLSEEDIEIIVVDDCSTDMTFSILENLKSDVVSNLVVLRHDINKQQGAARNTGLNAAIGQYVWFVDVDDSLGESILCQLESEELKMMPDIFQFHAAAILPNNTVAIEPYWKDTIGPMSGIKFLEFEAYHAYNNRIRASWSKWYKRDYLIKNKLFYQEGVYWEDVVHTLKCIYLANSVVYKPIIGYNYIHTPNSDMRGRQSGKKYADTIRFCAESSKFLIESSASSEIIESMRPYYAKVLRKYQRNLGQLTIEEFKRFCQIVSEIDLTYISKFLNTNEHDWLLDIMAMNKLWISQNNEN